MRLLSLFRQLRALRSAPWRAVASRAATLPLDYLAGDGTSRALVNVTLEVTYLCNITCEFCFLKESVLHERRDELTLAEIERLAEQAAPFGASFFITGGEPFLRRDLPEIVAAIKRRGLRVGVNTNGLLVDEAAGRAVREAGLDYAIFSLHGPPEVHDCLENRRGAFEAVLANLGTFARSKGETRLLVNCVVAKANASRLSELPGLLRGIPVDGITYQHETFLTADEVARHERVWEVLFPGWELPMVYQSSGYGGRDLELLEREVAALSAPGASDGAKVFWKPDLSGEALRSWYSGDMQVKGRCLYIWTDVRVEPDGLVNACQVMPTPMGNVRTTSLEQILNNERYRAFRAKNQEAGGVFPACARCCKLYRNPINFTAREPAWRAWV